MLRSRAFVLVWHKMIAFKATTCQAIEVCKQHRRKQCSIRTSGTRTKVGLGLRTSAKDDLEMKDLFCQPHLWRPAQDRMMRGSEAVSLVHHWWAYSHWTLRTTCACWFEKPMRSNPYQWSANANRSAHDLPASRVIALGLRITRAPCPTERKRGTTTR